MATTTQSSKTSTQPRSQPNLPFGMKNHGAQQASEFSQTGIDRVAALYVKNPGGTLSIQTGRDINLTAAKVDSQGSATLQAGNEITLGTVTTERTTNINFDADNYNRSSSSKDDITLEKNAIDKNDYGPRSRLFDKWGGCMQSKGYTYLEQCDDRCLYP
jgi:filamentous hemagglutinin